MPYVRIDKYINILRIYGAARQVQFKVKRHTHVPGSFRTGHTPPHKIHIIAPGGIAQRNHNEKQQEQPGNYCPHIEPTSILRIKKPASQN
jgi:hypothetical protein